MMSIEAEWIEWKGGECPVDAGTLVDARDADGYEWIGRSALKNGEVGLKFWKHDCDPFNAITAYRIHNAFKDAPDEATHLLGHADMRAFVTLRDGEYYDPEDALRCRGATYNVSPGAWQVIATRNREESAADKYKPKFDNVQNFGVLPQNAYSSAEDHAGEAEYTGGSVSYYTAEVTHPTNPHDKPYTAQCNDIIEALQMNYAEGNAFKAIWRKCAARLGAAKKGYTDGLYDAEKVVFFGERMVEQERNK